MIENFMIKINFSAAPHHEKIVSYNGEESGLNTFLLNTVNEWFETLHNKSDAINWEVIPMHLWAFFPTQMDKVVHHTTGQCDATKSPSCF